MATPTPHNSAKLGDIAELVIMPGDPKRAEFIAKNFLKDAKCFNEARGMLGFTGDYNGKRVSVMGSGMGMPSMGIYSYELFAFYDVKYIIRIGTCGSYLSDAELGDLYLVRESRTDSNFGYTLAKIEEKSLPSSDLINKALASSAADAKIKTKDIKAYASDIFYRPGKLGEEMSKAEKDKMRSMGIAGVDMESYALFANAKLLGKNAACMLTVSDVIGSDKNMTVEERQNSLVSMIKVALGSSKYLLK